MQPKCIYAVMRHTSYISAPFCSFSVTLYTDKFYIVFIFHLFYINSVLRLFYVPQIIPVSMVAVFIF